MNNKSKFNSAVIYLDLKNNSIDFYMMDTKGTIIQDGSKINATFLSKDYYDQLTQKLLSFGEKYSPLNAINATVVLPDQCVFTNIASFPNQSIVDNRTAYNTYLTNTFKNIKDLTIDSNKVVINKQFTTMCLTGVKKDIVSSLKVAFTNARMEASNFTYASSSTLAAINSLSSKLKSSTSYMFVDIKEKETRYILVNKGKPIGFFNLSMGYQILNENLANEDELLYQPAAELTVMNAKEKVKQKNSLNVSNENIDDATVSIELWNQAASGFMTSRKKKTSKFIQKDAPNDYEHKVYENFRIFMRWALDILENNNKLISIGKPSAIFVNMPAEYNFLFDIASYGEHKIKFVSAGLIKEKPEIIKNLELYGGLLVKSYKSIILFD